MFSQFRFLKQFAQNAGITRDNARDYLYMIEDEIAAALQASRQIKLTPIGTLKRVRQPSKTIKYLNDPSQNILILDRYYMRMRPSNTLKNRLKGIAPRAKTPSDDGIKVDHSISVPIKFRPQLPSLSWRTPMSGLTLDLRSSSPNVHQRLLRNYLRQATQNPRGISIGPEDITTYGAQKSTRPISSDIYNLTVDSVKKYLPQTLRNPAPWRLLVNLPPRELLHFSALPDQNNWVFHINYPRSINYQKQITAGAFDEDIAQKLNVIFHKGEGNIVVLGDRLSRALTIDLIKKKLDESGIHYHYFVEHHHHSTHPYLTHSPDMRHLNRQNLIHNAAIFNELSAADSLHHIHAAAPISIYSLPLHDKTDFLRLLRLQQIKPQHIDLILENYALPGVCPNCAASTQPAVKFPAMRRLAAQKGKLLHVHPVRVKCDCGTDSPYELITIAHTPDSDSTIGLNDALYRLALDHKINSEVVEKYID